MKRFVIAILGVFTLALYSCKDDEPERIEDPIGDETVELNYTFEANDEGWDAGIVGILADEEDIYGFEVDHVTAPYDENSGALLLSASNPNNNLFMYASKHVTGLEANTRYEVSYSIRFASVVDIDTTGIVVDVDTTGTVTDTTGIGNDTTGYFANVNDTVIIKAGAINEEPLVAEDETNYLELVGIDVGEPGADGNHLVVIGSFKADADDTSYTLQTASTENPISVMTNNDGDLWLIIGAESFGTSTEIYIDRIDVEIER